MHSHAKSSHYFSLTLRMRCRVALYFAANILNNVQSMKLSRDVYSTYQDRIDVYEIYLAFHMHISKEIHSSFKNFRSPENL
jgi:hypothetical protein